MKPFQTTHSTGFKGICRTVPPKQVTFPGNSCVENKLLWFEIWSIPYPLK